MLKQDVVQIPEDDEDDALKSQRLSVRSSGSKKGPNYTQINNSLGDDIDIIQQRNAAQGQTEYGRLGGDTSLNL